MTHHDITMINHDDSYDAQKLLNDLDAVKRISPDFSNLSLDMQEVMKESSNPAFLAALLFKLTKEREETNEILRRLEQKFAKVQELLQTKQGVSFTPTHEETVLAEPDQHIMHIVDQFGSVSAIDIQTRLAYKNPNAASQRLCNLVRQGHLKRVRSGKKVMFMRQHPTPSVESTSNGTTR